MSEKLLKIIYRCQHPDCQIKSCRTGEITINESMLQHLSSSCEDNTQFKSPRGICRLGFPQTFKVIEVRKLDETGAEEGVSGVGGRVTGVGTDLQVCPDVQTPKGSGTDPIEILKKDHKGVLNKLELIEEMIRRRDLDGLWITTAAVENDITLHSIRKEEGVLFPLLKGAFPMSDAQIEIIKEDHSELLALLHSVRDALRDGDILDGVAMSMISNLRGHIRKEDDEFFEMVSHYLDDEKRKLLLEGMAKAESSHLVIEAGERRKEATAGKGVDSTERERFKEALAAVKESNREDHCH